LDNKIINEHMSHYFFIFLFYLKMYQYDVNSLIRLIFSTLSIQIKFDIYNYHNQFTSTSWPHFKGGIISEKSEGFLHLQLSKKNTPKHYPKLLHPVHGNDKLLIKYNMFQVKKYYSYEM